MSAGLVGLWAVALLSPGPDVVMVLRQSMVGSRRAGFVTALGVVAGIAIWIVVAMVGLSVVVDRDPGVARVLEAVGGCLLALIGVVGLAQLARARRGTAGARATEPGTSGSFLRGLVTNIANPKALVFFGALFAQFLHDTSVLDHLLVLAVMIGMALAWFVGLALAASLRGFAERYRRLGSLVDLIGCCVFVGVGTSMAVVAL